MMTDIPLLYELLGLVLAAVLLTYLTQGSTGRGDFTRSGRRMKKARKLGKQKQTERLQNRQPALLADGRVELAAMETKSTQSIQVEETNFGGKA